MRQMTRRDLLYGLAIPGAVVLTLGLGACAVEHYGPPAYTEYPDYYYDYYFYPEIDVYFHIFTSDYYYRHDGRWWRARALPRTIWLNRRHRVLLHIKKDRPYDDYRDHYSKYHKPDGRDRDRDRRDRDDENRREREHNFERHLEYHKRRER